MANAYDLLEKQANDQGEPNYTEKQLAILRETLENPHANVDEVADATGSHANYTRGILSRIDLEMLRESGHFEEYDLSATHAEMEQDNADMDESEEDVHSPEAEYTEAEEESAAIEEPAELPTGDELMEGEPDDTDIVLQMQQDIPMDVQVTVPSNVIYRAVRSAVSIAPEPDEGEVPTAMKADVSEHTIELDADLVESVEERFDVGPDRARAMIAKIGTDRAEELTGQVPEVEEVMEETEINPDY